MKRIAVFDYSILSLETMRRLNPTLCYIIFIGNHDTEANLIADQGFETAIIDFRDDEALKAVGIGTDIAIVFCFYTNGSDNAFLTISVRHR